MAELDTLTVQNLTTSTPKPLAANQAPILKGLIDAEVTRAQAAEALKADATALTAEVNRAQAAEALKADITALAAEVTRAQAAEALKADATALATEVTRIAALELSQGTQDTAIAARATAAQLATEVARIAALELSQATQDTAIADRLLKADVLDNYSGGATKAASAERAKDLDTRVTELATKVNALESRDLEIGGTVLSGNFNASLGVIEPFSISAGNAVCLPPATPSLVEGSEFAVVLFGVPTLGNTCVIDFPARGQLIHGRNETVTITDEVSPARFRWSATHTSWFLLN